MTTRRGLLATAAFAGRALPMGHAQARTKQADFTFVKKAASMGCANGKLTSKGVSRISVFFSDRPDRIAGNMPTKVCGAVPVEWQSLCDQMVISASGYEGAKKKILNELTQ
jgi:hypothetical protein